jgi:hypothetical protein
MEESNEERQKVKSLKKKMADKVVGGTKKAYVGTGRVIWVVFII